MCEYENWHDVLSNIHLALKSEAEKQSYKFCPSAAVICDKVSLLDTPSPSWPREQISNCPIQY